MAKPSGIKITDAISRLAGWYNSEKAKLSRFASQAYITYETSGFIDDCWYLSESWGVKSFSSFTALRNWMEAEIRRQKILFRRY